MAVTVSYRRDDMKVKLILSFVARAHKKSTLLEKLVSMEKSKIDIQPTLPIKVPVMCVIGGPGCGKGTLCQLLALHYNLFHISVGDLLREEAKSGSQSSLQIARSLKAGEIVEDVGIVLGVLEKKMLQNTKHNGYLLDGFPRNVKHGSEFEAKIAPINCVLFMQASKATLIKRLTNRAKNSDRIDDDLAIVEKRIDLYLSSEPEILKKYSTRIRKIPCENSIKEVFNSTITILNEYFVSKQK